MINLRVKRLKGFVNNTKGLIGKNSPAPILLNTRYGIHTFALKFPIDVVILDDGWKVKKLKQVSPNRLFFWNPKYNNVLELPNGYIDKFKIHEGLKITLTFQ